MGELIDNLNKYAGSEAYPFHMPGHKRQDINNSGADFSFVTHKFDITEINGFDDLHNPEEILKRLKNRISQMYGSEEAYILVNGSTSGILTALSASAPYGSRILIARNCHKSVYDAAILRGFELKYIYPHLDSKMGIYCGILPDDVNNILKNDSSIRAVVITSPTYEGVSSDIRSISEIVHSYGIPLIVDSAHGAHSCMDMGDGIIGYKNPVLCNADIVVMSLHKTLPALTQTAVMLVQGKIINRKDIEIFYHAYITSSPSYLLISSVEACIDFMEEDSKSFLKYAKLLKSFYEECRLDNLVLHKTDDLSKIIIGTWSCNINGTYLKDTLRNQYGLEMEMASREYVLAMTSVCDSEQGLIRLKNALMEIDKTLIHVKKSDILNIPVPEAVKNIYDTLMCADIVLCLKDVSGMTSGGFIYAYPPGIPVIAPGEVFTEEIIQYIYQCCKSGIKIRGITDDMKVRVCKTD